MSHLTKSGVRTVSFRLYFETATCGGREQERSSFEAEMMTWWPPPPPPPFPMSMSLSMVAETSMVLLRLDPILHGQKSQVWSITPQFYFVSFFIFTIKYASCLTIELRSSTYFCQSAFVWVYRTLWVVSLCFWGIFKVTLLDLLKQGLEFTIFGSLYTN